MEQSRTFKVWVPRARPSAWLGSLWSLAGCLTVGLAHGLLRSRTAEANIGAEIMLPARRPFVWFSGSQPFTMSAAHAGDLQHIEGVRMAVPIARIWTGPRHRLGLAPGRGIPLPVRGNDRLTDQGRKKT